MEWSVQPRIRVELGLPYLYEKFLWYDKLTGIQLSLHHGTIDWGKRSYSETEQYGANSPSASVCEGGRPAVCGH